ncbi:MAG: hypothetical protein R3183_00300 [Oleiphilaceae bacterium]|nr:hypothetical protein [Oleiphilaceae bacterium]
MTHKKQDQTQTLTSRALDQSVEGLPSETRQALNQARQRAMAARQRQWTFHPLLAMACSLALVGLLWVNLTGDETATPADLALNDSLDAVDTFTYLTVLDDTEHEIVEELEFAIWLSQELETGGADDLSERS